MGASLERLELLGHSAFAESAKWETCTSTTEVMRKLTNADSKRTEAQPREGSHTIIGLKLPGGGVLAFIDQLFWLAETTKKATP